MGDLYLAAICSTVRFVVAVLRNRGPPCRWAESTTSMSINLLHFSHKHTRIKSDRSLVKHTNIIATHIYSVGEEAPHACLVHRAPAFISIYLGVCKQIFLLNPSQHDQCAKLTARIFLRRRFSRRLMPRCRFFMKTLDFLCNSISSASLCEPMIQKSTSSDLTYWGSQVLFLNTLNI